MSKKNIQIIVVWAWILIALVWWVFAMYGSPQKAILLLIQWIIQNPASILIYVWLYFIRPFTFVPVGWLSTIAWSLRWWWPWLAIALWWEMLSACVAFANGRVLWPEWLEQKKEESFGKFSFIMMRYPVVAVMLSRMSPLPDDVVNYGRGMMRISWFIYIRGSLLGNVIFSILNIWMGRQIEPTVLFTQGLWAGINWPILIVTVVIYCVVLFISRLIYKRIAPANN